MKRPADTCECGGSLFSGYFDADDYAFPLSKDTPKEQIPEGVRRASFCNERGAAMTKVRADHLKPGDVIDFDGHKYYELYHDGGDDLEARHITGQQEVSSIEIRKYGTTASGMHGRPASRGVLITFTNGRSTFSSFSVKYSVLG